MKRMLVETMRPNRLFVSLAEAIDLDPLATETLMADLLARVDATPATLTNDQLLRMRRGLVAVIECVFPLQDRPAALARLEALLTPPA